MQKSPVAAVSEEISRKKIVAGESSTEDLGTVPVPLLQVQVTPRKLANSIIMSPMKPAGNQVNMS